jgi:hypothetical protein
MTACFCAGATSPFTNNRRSLRTNPSASRLSGGRAFSRAAQSADLTDAISRSTSRRVVGTVSGGNSPLAMKLRKEGTEHPNLSGDDQNTLRVSVLCPLFRSAAGKAVWQSSGKGHCLHARRWRMRWSVPSFPVRRRSAAHLLRRRLDPKQAHSDRERDCAEVTPTDPT